MTTCLVLEGGAKRGIYTAGVLDVLLENGIKADCVIGVSAGAIHGCSYVSEQAGRSIRYYIKYNDDYRFMSIRSWLKTGNVVDEQFAYHELPEKLDPFDNVAFMKSKSKFYVVCTNAETGKPEYIHCKDMFKDIDFLRASASLPFFSHIVETGGMKLLDGGTTDGIPLKKAISMGYDKIIVVQTRIEGYRKTPSRIMNFFANLKYRKYPNLIEAIKTRYLNYNSTLDYIDEMVDQDKILRIRPSRYVKISRMEPNVEIVKQMYELGREDATHALEDIKKFL